MYKVEFYFKLSAYIGCQICISKVAKLLFHFFLGCHGWINSVIIWLSHSGFWGCQPSFFSSLSVNSLFFSIHSVSSILSSLLLYLFYSVSSILFCLYLFYSVSSILSSLLFYSVSSILSALFLLFFSIYSVLVLISCQPSFFSSWAWYLAMTNNGAISWPAPPAL